MVLLFGETELEGRGDGCCGDTVDRVGDEGTRDVTGGCTGGKLSGEDNGAELDKTVEVIDFEEKDEGVSAESSNTTVVLVLLVSL